MQQNQKIRRGRKFDQVIDGAKQIFLRDGYAGASVDDIAQAAHVSKATLYSYFPDKRLMFEEAVGAEMARLAMMQPIDIPNGMPATKALPLLSRQIAGWLVAPHTVSLYRVHVAEAGRFSEMSRNFAASQRAVLRDRLRTLLDHWVAGGELVIPDTSLAAEQLIRLAGADIHDNAIRDSVQPDAIDRIADAAADVFLRAYKP